MSQYKFIKLEKSTNMNKKYMAIFKNIITGREKTIHFGAKGMEDYTIHKDKKRMMNYIIRHQYTREDWEDSGIMTAGWWSRWLLWSKPDFNSAYKLVLSKLKKAGY